MSKKAMEDIKKRIKDAISANQINEVGKAIGKLSNDTVPICKEVQDLLNTSLYDAAQLGLVEIVQELVQCGADVNYEDCLQQSVLLQTVMSRTSERTDEVVEFLLSNGSNINHRNRNGQSDFVYLMASGLLSYSSLVQFVDALDEVGESDLRTGGSYLHLVSNCLDDENRIVMMKKLLKMGLDVNGKDNNDDTPAHLMATIADCSALQFLVKNGADINARNRLGETVLHSLAGSNELSGFEESLNFLLEMGINVNEIDFNGRTAIHHALMSKDTDTEAIEKFLSRGIKINVKDRNGRNEIYAAVDNVNTQYYSPSDLERRAMLIQHLANAGVDVNEADMYGVTPLHVAATKGNLDILVTLIGANADVMKKCTSGASALHWSCRIYNMAHVLIHMYLEQCHSIDVVDNHGSTALHWAVWFRQIAVSQSLLQAGCDFRIKDDSKNTPVDLAKKMLFTEFLDLVENESYKSLEGLSLEEPSLKCNGNETFSACPLLRYIRKEDRGLDMDTYVEHLKSHEASLAKCGNASLDLENMGLFYDIEENTSVPEIVDYLMLSLKERVGERNSLFQCEVSLAGSVGEGTKVNLPDEFDYMWTLKEFSKAFAPVESPCFPESFVKVNLVNKADEPRFRKYITKEKFLDCSLLIRDFYRTVNEEFISILKDGRFGSLSNLMCLELLNEIFCTNSSLCFRVFGKEAKFLRVSVDIVPAMWFQRWTPRDLKGEDLRHLTGQDFPVIYVITKTPDRCFIKEFTQFFRISYVHLEQRLMKEVPKVIKQGYILLKILIESGYLPTVVNHDKKGRLDKYVTSYHLKTCLLHEVGQWRRDDSGGECMNELIASGNKRRISCVWAKRIVDRYEKCVQEKFLATFFETKKNLLGISGMESVIREKDIFVDMVNLLQFLVDVVYKSNVHWI